MKIEEAALSSSSLIGPQYGLCERKATLNCTEPLHSQLRNYMKVEVAVLGSSSITVHMVSVDVMQR